MKAVKAVVVAAGMSVADMDDTRAPDDRVRPAGDRQQMQQLQQRFSSSTLKQQLEQGQQLYSSLNRVTDVNSWHLSSHGQIRSVLPTDYKQIQNLFSGSGRHFGTAASSFLSGNSHYTSAGNDFYTPGDRAARQEHGRRPEPRPVHL